MPRPTSRPGESGNQHRSLLEQSQQSAQKDNKLTKDEKPKQLKTNLKCMHF